MERKATKIVTKTTPKKHVISVQLNGFVNKLVKIVELFMTVIYPN